MKKQVETNKRKPKTPADREPDKRYFAISRLDTVVGQVELITPDAIYTIANNRIASVELVADYDSEVRKRMSELAERALVAGGFYHGEYRIQFNPEVKIRLA
ncbi:MAG: hypothetical protein KKB21_01565 [Nanoarchaeota archaeon]|nr:hypothetical protein [Nanoarchaeota archaeon]MBU4086244.1 hypothetical protein [Nanoarchaeota archaeon]